jgi:hypothetical protein
MPSAAEAERLSPCGRSAVGTTVIGKKYNLSLTLPSSAAAKAMADKEGEGNCTNLKIIFQ